MPELSRAQLAVYAAIAIVALMLGARWIRSADSGATASGSIAYGSEGASGAAEGDVELSKSGEDLVVHVAGAVRHPGVYRLPDGSRVTDAIDRAGGVAPGAAPDAINLAAPLADGQQIHLPGRSQAPAGVAGGTGLPVDGPINLGSATAEQLDTIEGIGPVTAAAILAFRDEHGGIASVDELDQISGIGPATMEALRARLQP